jgi:ubiquinone/menaquinone biosynthesis C-methylase UbiE
VNREAIVMSDCQRREYWDSKAETMGPALEATMRDTSLRRLEIDLLLERLAPEDLVLDVGCGNGAATVIFSQWARHVLGVDFSAKMVEQAEKLAAETASVKSRVSFREANVLDLSALAPNPFDVVISERCLINLANWEEQRRAILEMKRVLKPGGRLLMIEGTVQGLERLNALRSSVGLHSIERHWHNVLFDETSLETFLKNEFEVRQIRKMGTYYFVSRVVHPLLVAPQEPSFGAKINEVARALALRSEGFPEVSINALYEAVKR